MKEIIYTCTFGLSIIGIEDKYTETQKKRRKKLLLDRRFYLSSLMLVILVDGGHVTSKSSKPRANECGTSLD